MEPKIFNELGFLSKEGKSFVNDGFTKEVRRVLATAQSSNDVLIIASILKSIIGDIAFEQAQKMSSNRTTNCISDANQVVSEEVSSTKDVDLFDMSSLLSSLTDSPLMQIEDAD
jgi:hypothetical protein